jgi:pimeloyl-ACP methyl ester carboxylesterase
VTSQPRKLALSAADGYPLAVQVSGPDDAPALLLLAGQANSHVWWDDLRGSFEDCFRVVTVDYRGTGGSRGLVGPWSISLFAADAAHVLAALRIGSASVYGTSMGGRVAQMLAIEHAQSVDRLMLACSSPGGLHAHVRCPDVRRALADPTVDRRVITLHRVFYTVAWPHGPAHSASRR